MQYFDHNLFPPSAPPRSFPTTLQSFLPSRWLGKTEIFGISRIVQKGAKLHLFLKLKKKKKVHQKKLKKTSFCNRERTDYHYPLIPICYGLLASPVTWVHCPFERQTPPTPNPPLLPGKLISHLLQPAHSLSFVPLVKRWLLPSPPHTPPLSLSPP